MITDDGVRGGQWAALLALFTMTSLLKLLVLAPGLYRSTDFEVRLVCDDRFHSINPPDTPVQRYCCTSILYCRNKKITPLLYERALDVQALARILRRLLGKR